MDTKNADPDQTALIFVPKGSALFLSIELQIGRCLAEKILTFFLFLQESIGCRYSLEAPRRGVSNE